MGQSRPVRASNPSVNARYALKAEIDGPLPIVLVGHLPVTGE
jgi:hypothetical protein